jgi:hypothetical protein
MEEQYKVPRDLTTKSLRGIIERVFDAFDPIDPMRDAMLTLNDSIPVIFSASHLIRYMVEKNWDFPAAFAAYPHLYIEMRREGDLVNWLLKTVKR